MKTASELGWKYGTVCPGSTTNAIDQLESGSGRGGRATCPACGGKVGTIHGRFGYHHPLSPADRELRNLRVDDAKGEMLLIERTAPQEAPPSPKSDPPLGAPPDLVEVESRRLERLGVNSDSYECVSYALGRLGSRGIPLRDNRSCDGTELLLPKPFAEIKISECRLPSAGELLLQAQMVSAVFPFRFVDQLLNQCYLVVGMLEALIRDFDQVRDERDAAREELAKIGRKAFWAASRER